MSSVFDERFRRPLLAFFQRRTGNFHEAEDLTQEVFLRLTRSAGTASIKNQNAYIFQVAGNLLRENVRRQHARKSVFHSDITESVNGPLVPPPLVEEIDAERILLGKEVLTALSAALMELPERTRDIFILYRLEQMRQSDIAARIGISVSAVEKHLAKAIAHISKRLNLHGK